MKVVRYSAQEIIERESLLSSFVFTPECGEDKIADSGVFIIMSSLIRRSVEKLYSYIR